MKQQGCQVSVHTHHPEVFSTLSCTILPYGDLPINAGYLDRKQCDTNQFEDICINLGIRPPPFVIDPHAEMPLDIEKPYCVVHQLYRPMPGIKRRFPEIDLLMPRKTCLQSIIDKYRSQYYFIAIGEANDALDVDHSIPNPSYALLSNLVQGSSLVITQPGHLMHLTEGLERNLFVLFSSGGLQCSHPFINSITPKKVLFKTTTQFGFDEEEDHVISF